MPCSLPVLCTQLKVNVLKEFMQPSSLPLVSWGVQRLGDASLNLRDGSLRPWQGTQDAINVRTAGPEITGLTGEFANRILRGPEHYGQGEPVPAVTTIKI